MFEPFVGQVPDAERLQVHSWWIHQLRIPQTACEGIWRIPVPAFRSCHVSTLWFWAHIDPKGTHGQDDSRLLLCVSVGGQHPAAAESFAAVVAVRNVFQVRPVDHHGQLLSPYQMQTLERLAHGPNALALRAAPNARLVRTQKPLPGFTLQLPAETELVVRGQTLTHTHMYLGDRGPFEIPRQYVTSEYFTKR